MCKKIKADIKNIADICELDAFVSDFLSFDKYSVFNSSEYTVLPGFCDVHVHFREPGFSYKETVMSGSLAAARGGYTDVLTMPNLNPVPDSAEHLKVQTDIIKEKAVINVHPYASITVGQKGETLSPFDELGDAIAFSDDGRGVQSEELMRNAMIKAKSLGKIVVAHCEVNDLLFGGYIHEGEYSKAHGHKGICSESEYKMIERDLALAKETGCKYHVCHISAKESVDLIRKAKSQGVDVTCETAPHYLVLDENDLKEDGRFKMNPPLRGKRDREALTEGILDGTIDMIATDHAPHSAEEKSKGLKNSAFGIVGLETAFPIMYTHFVKPGIITLPRLIELLAVNPRRRFSLNLGSDFSVWKLSEEYRINPDDFLSKGKATPFSGSSVFGKCVLTVHDGKEVYNNL